MNDGNNGARCSDCGCLAMGDVAEHIMNTNVFGVVIGFQGSLVGLRVSQSLATMWFHEYELRPLDDDGGPVGGAEVDLPDNVVDLADYKLTAATKTKGAA